MFCIKPLAQLSLFDKLAVHFGTSGNQSRDLRYVTSSKLGSTSTLDKPIETCVYIYLDVDEMDLLEKN